jgi:hypothetical protein
LTEQVQRAEAIVTDWSEDNLLGEDVDLSDVADGVPVSDLIEDLLAMRDGGSMSSYTTVVRVPF